MATTTNYGWTTPDNTALVKDGASAIRALGTAIDTSMNTALGTKKSGLVLLNTTSFSGVASQAITPVFSATYDVYKIIVYFTTASTADCDVYIKMRSGATDASTNYAYAYPYLNVGGAVTSLNGSALTTGVLIGRLDSGTVGYANSSDITIFNPFAAQFTAGTITLVDRNSAGTLGGGAGGFNHGTATSYDGFNLIASTGNMSGVCSVFGVNK